MKFKSEQNLSQLENFYKAVRQLDYRQLSYGFYDEPHYSGLNVATLAAIHQQGWGGLPERPFMTSAAIAFNKDMQRFQKQLFGQLVSGADPDSVLRKMGQAGANKIKFIIDSGSFPNNTVSDSWAGVKGFSEAMYHYGDLKNSATFKLSKGKKSEA